MPTISPSVLLFSGRPTLGAVAFAACLAGGTSTQNMAGTPRPVDNATYAKGWQYGASRAPVVAVDVLRQQLTMAPSIAPVARLASVAPKPDLRARIQRVVRDPVGFQPLAITSATINPLVASAPSVPAGLGSDLAISAEPAVTAAVIANPAAPIAEVAVPIADLVNPVSTSAVGSAPAIAAYVPPPALVATPAPLKIVSSPELRHFDLAAFRKPAVKPGALAGSRKGAVLAAKTSLKSRLVDDIIFRQTPVSIAGQSGGEITVRIGPDAKPSVKVADLLGLVSGRLDPDTMARFSLASSAGEYVSFATLRSAGFDVSYNAAYDSIAIGVTP
ncbi:hypothetical protein [Novosphingobium sp.]|uniref:hypothetical protein n=1 Tax=Novosphingobium sp. TaxID=1874826 RepID=UPI0025F836D3|nr:hypothetical protein [Novosphingobium sp.]